MELPVIIKPLIHHFSTGFTRASQRNKRNGWNQHINSLHPLLALKDGPFGK
jgi:hypothetical protein